MKIHFKSRNALRQFSSTSGKKLESEHKVTGKWSFVIVKGEKK